MSFETLRALIQTQTGLATIWSNPNAPRPALPYVTLQVTSDVETNRQEISTINSSGIVDIGQHGEAVLSIQFFESRNGNGRLARDRAQALRMAFKKPTVLDALAAAGFPYRREAGIFDIPAMVGTGFESRATLDVTLGYLAKTTDDHGYVETIIGTGTIPPQSFPFEVTI